MCEDHVHVELQRRVLADNDDVAAELRHRFQHSETLTLNLISSPGSGKTTLLETTVKALDGRLRLGALEGDVATERDADRLRRLGVPARQILTGGACHLDARQVLHEMDHWGHGQTFDILFVENVGNLVCPATYDLGEDFKVALLSVTEGDDKPFKYPAVFSHAAVTVITKADLLPHVDFDVEAVRRQIATLAPDAVSLVTSATTGEGMEDWYGLLDDRLADKRRTAAEHTHV